MESPIDNNDLISILSQCDKDEEVTDTKDSQQESTDINSNEEDSSDFNVGHRL